MVVPKLAQQIKEAKHSNPSTKVDFNAIPVPKNYVAGMGRGATGFTTRSDIGPAKFGAAADGGVRLATLLPELCAHHATQQEAAAAGPRAQPQPEEQQQFDAFLGNDAGMFAKSAYGEYDKDDEEADAVWNMVDERMDERRREHREKRLAEEIEKYRLENPKITEQFADLKRKLGTMSEVCTSMRCSRDGYCVCMLLNTQNTVTAHTAHHTVLPMPCLLYHTTHHSSYAPTMFHPG